MTINAFSHSHLDQFLSCANEKAPAQVQGPLDGVVAPGEGAVGPLLPSDVEVNMPSVALDLHGYKTSKKVGFGMKRQGNQPQLPRLKARTRPITKRVHRNCVKTSTLKNTTDSYRPQSTPTSNQVELKLRFFSWGQVGGWSANKLQWSYGGLCRQARV